MPDPYVYSGTDILKNTLGIQNKKTLDDAEADYVSLRIRELAENPLKGDYDFTHITKMHEYIFALVAYCAVFHDLGDLSRKEYLEKIIRGSLESVIPVIPLTHPARTG